MRLSEIYLKNIKCIPEMRIKAGNHITVVSGDNAQGKSAVLDAVRDVFDGGYDPYLVTDGEKTGVVVLTMDDGTKIEKVINRERQKTDLTIYSADGSQIKAPKAFVEQLAASFAYDPLAFIAADPKKRAKFIGDWLKVPLEEHELVSIAGPESRVFFKAGVNAFDVIAAARDHAYDHRRGANIAHRDLTAAIANLRGGMDTLNESSEDLAQAERTASAEQSAAIDRRKDRLTEISTRDARIRGEIEAELQRKIAEARCVAAERIQALAAETETATAEARAIHDPLIDVASRAHQQARERLDAWNRAIGARDYVRKQEELVKQYADQIEDLNRVLEQLDALRNEKLQLIPIQGMSIEAGVIKFNGLDFDALNTAEQYKRAVQICSQGRGDLPLMVVDNLECLGPDNRALFEAAITEAGFQLVAAERTEGPLSVEAR